MAKYLLRIIAVLLTLSLAIGPAHAAEWSHGSTASRACPITPFTTGAIVAASFISVGFIPHAAAHIHRVVSGGMELLKHPPAAVLLPVVIMASLLFAPWITLMILKVIFNFFPHPGEESNAQPAAEERSKGTAASVFWATIAATALAAGLSTHADALSVVPPQSPAAISIGDQNPNSGTYVPIKALVAQYASPYGAERPAIMERLLGVESNFNPDALSRRDARGIAQMKYATAVWFLSSLRPRDRKALELQMKVRLADFRPEHLYDPRIEIPLACAYFQYLVVLFKGDVYTAASAYNTGQGRIIELLREKKIPFLLPGDLTDPGIRDYAQTVTYGPGQNAPKHVFKTAAKGSVAAKFLGIPSPQPRSGPGTPQLDMRLKLPDRRPETLNRGLPGMRQKNFHRLGMLILGAALAIGSWAVPARAQVGTMPANPSDVAPELALNGWVTSYHRGDAGTVFKDYVKRLKELSIFGVDADRKGRIVQDKGLIASVLAAVKGESKPPRLLLTVTNDRGRHLKDHTLLMKWISTPTQRNAHIADLLALAKQVDGLDIDYENLRARDGLAFALFVQELGDKLHADGKYLAVTIETKTLFNDIVDWDALSNHLDRVRVMAYPYHFERTEPGAVAPPVNVRRLAMIALNRMPPEKLEIALPLYGYDWPAHGRGTVVHTRSEYMKLSQKPGAKVFRDEYSQSARIQYTVVRGKGKKARTIHHSVYFEDSTSVNYKVQQLIAEGVQNIGFWHMGMASEDLLGLIQSQRVLAKHPREVSVPAKNPDAPVDPAPEVPPDAPPLPDETPVPDKPTLEMPATKPTASRQTSAGAGVGQLLALATGFLAQLAATLPIDQWASGGATQFLARTFVVLMQIPNNEGLNREDLAQEVSRRANRSISVDTLRVDLTILKKLGLVRLQNRVITLTPFGLQNQGALTTLLRNCPVSYVAPSVEAQAELAREIEKSIPGYKLPAFAVKNDDSERAFINTRLPSDIAGLGFVVRYVFDEPVFQITVAAELAKDLVFPAKIVDQFNNKWNLLLTLRVLKTKTVLFHPPKLIKKGNYVAHYTELEPGTKLFKLQAAHRLELAA